MNAVFRTQSRASLLALLVLLLFSIYLFTYNGTFRVDDEHITAARAQSYAIWGGFSEPQVYGNERIRALSTFGDQATQVEPAQSFIGAIFYRLGVASGIGGVRGLFLLSMVAAVVTAALIYLTVLLLGFESRVGVGGFLIFGLATMAWPYAMTFYRDGLAMMFVAMLFIGWAGFTQSTKRKFPLLMAVGFVGGVLTKNTVVAILPSLLITSLILGFDPAHRSLAKRTGIYVLISVIASLALVAIIPAHGPLSRFSIEYYAFLLQFFSESLVGNSWFYAMLGPFLSPARSIFLFSPPLLLSFIGGALGWKRMRPFVILSFTFAVFLGLGQALFYRESWAGGFGWGLRFMLPALPALIVLIAPVIQRLLTRDRSIEYWGFYTIIAVGFLVQIAGVLLPWRMVFHQWEEAGLNPFTQMANWSISFLPIPMQIANLLHIDQWETAWVRSIRAGDPAGAVFPLLVSLFSILLFQHVYKHLKRPDQHYRWGRRESMVVLLGIVLMLPVFFWVLRSDPVWKMGEDVHLSALEWVAERAGPEDTVVIDSYGTSLWLYWMDRWKGEAHWYSLPFEIQIAAPSSEPSDTSLGLFTNLPGEAATIWYVISSDTPGYALARNRQWLDETFIQSGAEIFGLDPAIEVFQYRSR